MTGLAFCALVAAQAPAQAQQFVDVEARAQIAELQDKYDGLLDVLQVMEVGLGVFSIVFVLMSLFTLWIWQKGENLSRASIGTINNIFQLTERVAQVAAGATLQEAREWIEEIDRKAREFIGQDRIRGFIESKPAKRRLDQISDELISYQRFVRRLRRVGQIDTAPGFTPHCHFVMGLAQNLAEDYDAAILSWDEGADMRGADKLRGDDAHITGLCHYWAGMAYNNQGKDREAISRFDEALKRFQRGRSARTAELIAKLKEHQLESSYFAQHDADFRSIQAMMRDAGQSPGMRVMCGNILLSWAIEHKTDASATKALSDAADHLEAAIAAKLPGPWARFGLAQVRWEQGDAAASEKLCRELLPDADKIRTNKIEERQILLGCTMRFICHCHIRDRGAAEADRNLIVDALHPDRIAEGTFLYSQFIMRNDEKANLMGQADACFAAHFP